MNVNNKTSSTTRWYCRTSICVTAGLFLAGLSYAIVMQWQLKNQETQNVLLQQALVQEKEKTQHSESLRKEKNTRPEYLHHRQEELRKQIASNEQKLEETRTAVQKLKKLDTVKDYLNQCKQLHEMKEQNQKLYQQVEDKKQHYHTLKKEFQER